MRTTLAIDDDVLDAAKTIARQRQSTIGEVISELARPSLTRPVAGTERNGVPLVDTGNGASIVTLEIVNALRDESA